MKSFNCDNVGMFLAKYFLRAWLVKFYVYFALCQVLKFSNYFSRDSI